MKATAEKVEKNTVLLEVEVEPEKFTRAVDQAYKKIVKTINVPGFRKGKAPRSIIERYYGKQALYDEAVELIIPDAYVNAVEDTGIEPVSQPELEIVQVEEGKPMVFKAKVVIKPEVMLGQYIGLEIVEPSKEIKEEDVQKELEYLQNRHAKLINIEDGIVEKSDLITIDFEGKKNGESFTTANDYSVEIGSNKFIPGFEEQIVGMTIDETKEFNVTFPDNYGKQDLAGQEAVFTVTLKTIRRKELSVLDDEFAKDVSEFDTLEELRADIENKLGKIAKDKANDEMRKQVLGKVVENTEVEIPNEMIDGRVQEMLRNMDMQLSGQGISLEKYLSNFDNSNIDNFKEKIRPDAIQGVKEILVLDTVVKAEDLSESDEDINEEILRMSGETKQDPAVVRKILEDQGQIEYIKDTIRRNKALQFMVDRAVLNKEQIDLGKE